MGLGRNRLRGAGLSQGPANLSGAGVPANTLGNNGDMYVDTSTGNVYIKALGTWVLTFDLTTIEGAQTYMVDIADDATPAPGTATVEGGTIPAAVNITDGSVAVDPSDGRVWQWVSSATPPAFLFRGRLTGQLWDICPEPLPPGGRIGDKCMDPEGKFWQWTGTQWAFTGVTFAADPGGTFVSGDCVYHRVGSLPPPADFGNPGEGAYTGGGTFMVKAVTGWPASPTGTFGGPDGVRYWITRVDELPEITSTAPFPLAVTPVFLLPNGDIYRWVRTDGNFARAGNLCAPGGVPIVQQPPGDPRFENVAGTPGQNAYTADIAVDAPPGAVDYAWTLSPRTVSFNDRITTESRIRITDFEPGVTYAFTCNVRNAQNIISGDVTASHTFPTGTTARTIPVPGEPTTFTRRGGYQ